MSGLSIAISGLRAGQAGLNVTGHNLANHHTRGFTRQLVHQSTFVKQTIGRNAFGAMQIGLGTNITGIRQVRDHFLDMRWRAEAPALNFWDVQVATGQRLDTIFGEMEGEFRLQGALRDFNQALHELNVEVPSISVRSNFVFFASNLVTRVQDAARSMEHRQMELNSQVKSGVRRINQLVTNIDDLNRRIAREEAGGSNPNDFLDRRNNYIDELATIIPIQVREASNGNINIIANGHALLVNGVQAHMGLQFSAPGSLFVHPVFTNSDEILSYEAENIRSFFNWPALNNMDELPNQGSLLSIIASRGLGTSTHMSVNPNSPEYNEVWNQFNIRHGTIPQVQMQLDTLMNSIVNMFNAAFASPSFDHGMPVNMEGNWHGRIIPPSNEPLDLRLFIEINPERGLTIDNIRINPEFTVMGGASRIPLTFDGEGDTRLVSQLVRQWTSASITMEQLLPMGTTLGDEVPFIQFPGWYGFSIDGFYRNFIDTMATNTSTAMGFLAGAIEGMNFLDNRRMEISGVSIEEEMSNLIRYQHAYNASARMINTIDSMLDRVINQTGRVGL